MNQNVQLDEFYDFRLKNFSKHSLFTGLSGKNHDFGFLWLGGDFKNLSLLEFYSSWLETLGKYYWMLYYYIKIMKKSIFQSFRTHVTP